MSKCIYDLFISHASEDKSAVAKPLAEELGRRGYAVWLDAFTLRLGDSLSGAIDRGLAQSRFGVVILSHHFFAKRWPARELSGLISREVASGDKVILPVWHGMSQGDILRYSPTLADRLATDTSNGIMSVVDEIISAIGVPGIHTSVAIPEARSFRFAPSEIGEIVKVSRVALHGVQPSPSKIRVVRGESLQVSGLVHYDVPPSVPDVIVTLEANRDPEDGYFWHCLREKRVAPPSGRCQLTGPVPPDLLAAIGRRRLQLRAGIVLFDNENGERHGILQSACERFDVAIV
jgi:hypothetical protein